MHWSSKHGYCVVELTGSVCRYLGPFEGVRLIQRIRAMGGVCSRLDVAVDADGPRESIIARAIEASRAGELVGARVWQPIEQFGLRGVRTGYGVTFGRRGDAGSGRYVRVYDKGLETGHVPEGQWERWEAEFSGDAAQEAACELFGEDNDAMFDAERAFGMAFGAAQFRVPGGRLSRRALSPWFEKLTAGHKLVRVVASRSQSTYDGWRQWLVTSVAPKLYTLADMFDVEPGRLLEVLVGSVEASRGAMSSQVILEALAVGPPGGCNDRRCDLPGPA